MNWLVETGKDLEEAFSASVRQWSTVANLDLSSLIRLPEEEFLIKRLEFIDHVRKELTTYVSNGRQEGRFKRRGSLEDTREGHKQKFFEC